MSVRVHVIEMNVKQAKVPRLFPPLLALAAIDGVRLGAQTVIASWLAVKFTGSVQGVGMLFGVGAVLALILARPIGYVVSAVRSKKCVILLGHGSMAAVGLLSVSLFHIGAHDPFWVLVLFFALSTVLRQLSAGGTDFFVRRLTPKSRLQKRIAALMCVGQISLTAGTAMAGVALLFLDLVALFAMLAILSGAAFGVSACCLVDEPATPPGEASPQTSGGLPVDTDADADGVSGDRILVVTMAGMAVAYAVGQFTNVLLPGLVHLQRGGSSFEYALIEIAWSFGSLLAGVALGFGRTCASSLSSSLPAGAFRVDLIVLGLLALSLSLVPMVAALPVLAGLHVLLGVGFVLVRVRGEARFLGVCPKASLGRARATSNMLMQTAALSAFAFPIVAGSLAVPTLYVGAAAMIGLSTLALAAACVRKRPVSPRR